MGAPPQTPWKALTPEEAGILADLAEEMIPADAYGPGARALNVARFVDWQLAEDAPYAHHLPAYRNHLSRIKGLSAAEVERRYRTFFDLALTHVKQGYWGHPRHGGNLQYGSYRMLDIAAPACTGRDVPPRARKDA